MSIDLSIDAEWSGLYIDGEWVTSKGDGELPVEDPSTREEITCIPAAVESDVDVAYESAAAA